MKRLVVLAGPDEGRAFPLESETVLLGRSRATDTRLIDPHVSRVHCQIQQESGQFVLSDFDSAGGTFVNGKRVSRHSLQNGDLIRIGATHMQFSDAAATAPPASSPAAKPSAAPARKTNWAEGLVNKEISHYKIGPVLARGRSGFVFHGRCKKRNIPVAIKILDEEMVRDQKMLQRFVRSMKAVMEVRHPHLLRVYGAGRSGGHCWIAEEYVPGESLAAVIGRIESPGQLEWQHAVRLGIYLGKALHYAHGKKLLHLSVTPHNVLLGKTPEQTRLADLMFAGALREDPTRPISAAGLPSEGLPFQAPERTDGKGSGDARTDVYGLGATLYAMMVGRPPFRGETVTELVQAIRTKPVKPLKDFNVPISDLFEKVLMKMLAKKPKDRFQTMRDVLKYFMHIAKKEKLG